MDLQTLAVAVEQQMREQGYNVRSCNLVRAIVIAEFERMTAMDLDTQYAAHVAQMIETLGPRAVRQPMSVAQNRRQVAV